MARTLWWLAGRMPPVAHVVVAGPHQPHRPADRLRDLRRLDGGLPEQAVPERAAAPDDVERHPVGRAGRSPRRPAAGDDRALRRAPELGPVGPDVGHAGPHLQRRVGREGELEGAVDRRRAERRAPRTAARRRAAPAKTCASESRAFGPGFHVMRSASRARCAWSKVCAVTATPVGMRVTRDDAGHPRGPRSRRPSAHRPADRRRPGHDRGLRAGDVDVEAVVGPAGDDVAGVDAGGAAGR